MKYGSILVTGGAGFIGSQLIKKLAPCSKHIYVIDDLSSGDKNLIPDKDNITFFQDTILNTKLLSSILPYIEHVFHLACRNLVLSIENHERDLETNLYGGYTLLNAIKTYAGQIKRFVYTSSASIYGNADILPTPESYHKIELPYAASKFAMEHYCQVYYHLYQLPVTIVRLSNVYGPGQLSTNPYCGVVAKFFDAIQDGKPFIIYGDGSQTRDFTYVEDAIDALMLVSAHSKAEGQVYNVGTGTETSINSLAQKIGGLTGHPCYPTRYSPKRPTDKVIRRAVDTSKIQKELNWRAKFSLNEGLMKTYEWIQNTTHK
ncbi:NAD-dependent epimerase/dehydratase family protein [Lihuaxuella thermophila]|nr:NAD-dependent epimerase/dehydratase family protein [Lihuaxuella thermophila]